MKTIEQQLDDMLPDDVKRNRELATRRAEYFDRLGKDLRSIGRVGVTAEQANRNLRRAMQHNR